MTIFSSFIVKNYPYAVITGSVGCRWPIAMDDVLVILLFKLVFRSMIGARNSCRQSLHNQYLVITWYLTYEGSSWQIGERSAASTCEVIVKSDVHWRLFLQDIFWTR